jgi:hypothetical protein
MSISQQPTAGITQPLDRLIAAVRALSPQEQELAQARIEAALRDLRAATRQNTGRIISEAAAVTPTDTSDGVPFSREQLLETVSAQYDANFATWKSAYLLSAEDLTNLAKKDTVMNWASTVPAETIQALKQYGPPRLKLLTDMEVEQLMRIMDQNKKIPGQQNGTIWWDQWKSIHAETGSFGLTVDMEDIPFDPSIYYVDPNNKQAGSRRNEDMVSLWERKYQAQALDLMPQYAYLPSAMDAMVRGQVYDKKYWTVFKRPQGVDRLPYALWSSDHVYLGGVPDYSFVLMRGRFWVRGR